MAKLKPETLKARARDYAMEHSLQSIGYVDFWKGKPCGWTREIDPARYMPGVLLVPLIDGDAVLVTVGGNPDDGATGIQTWWRDEKREPSSTKALTAEERDALRSRRLAFNRTDDTKTRAFKSYIDDNGGAS